MFWAAEKPAARNASHQSRTPATEGLGAGLNRDDSYQRLDPILAEHEIAFLARRKPSDLIFPVHVRITRQHTDRLHAGRGTYRWQAGRASRSGAVFGPRGTRYIVDFMGLAPMAWAFDLHIILT